VLHVALEEKDETVILHCIGRIVRGHETALLCAAVGRYGRSIILDLTEVDAIDAAGVGALISLQAAGIYLRLRNPNKAIGEVLRVTRLDSIVEICGSPVTESYKNEVRQRPSTEPIPLRLVAIAS
jgi:anti-anti-sigma factor